MPDSGKWVRAARIEDVPSGQGYETDIEVDGEFLGLFNIDGEFFALGECTHEQGPLCQGRISGHTVTCPWHSARFDIRTGECVEGPVACRVAGDVTVGTVTTAVTLDRCRSYPVKALDGHVYIRIE